MIVFTALVCAAPVQSFDAALNAAVANFRNVQTLTAKGTVYAGRAASRADLDAHRLTDDPESARVIWYRRGKLDKFEIEDDEVAKVRRQNDKKIPLKGHPNLAIGNISWLRRGRMMTQGEVHFVGSDHTNSFSLSSGDRARNTRMLMVPVANGGFASNPGLDPVEALDAFRNYGVLKNPTATAENYDGMATVRLTARRTDAEGNEWTLDIWLDPAKGHSLVHAVEGGSDRTSKGLRANTTTVDWSGVERVGKAWLPRRIMRYTKFDEGPLHVQYDYHFDTLSADIPATEPSVTIPAGAWLLSEHDDKRTVITRTERTETVAAEDLPALRNLVDSKQKTAADPDPYTPAAVPHREMPAAERTIPPVAVWSAVAIVPVGAVWYFRRRARRA